MRFILAIKVFFAILFGKTIPQLPPHLLPPPPPDEGAAERARLATRVASLETQLADLKEELDGARRGRREAEQQRDAAGGERDRLQRELEAARADLARAAGERKQADEQAADKLKRARDDGALAVLAWLQREGRLLDFLMESVDGFDDAQVGAAARAIHQGCRKVVDQGLGLEPVLPGEEGARVEVARGFDPVAIQLTGNVRGEPPFQGTLMHHGWRARSVKVPVPEGLDATVLAPAEVEL